MYLQKTSRCCCCWSHNHQDGSRHESNKSHTAAPCSRLRATRMPFTVVVDHDDHTQRKTARGRKPKKPNHCEWRQYACLSRHVRVHVRACNPCRSSQPASQPAQDGSDTHAFYYPCPSTSEPKASRRQFPSQQKGASYQNVKLPAS